jgi:MraZ protein
MPAPAELILGEFTRTLDERYRLSLPSELLDPLMLGTSDAILAKERPGALSLWNASVWREKLDAGVALVHGKMRAGKLEGRWDEVQSLGRLLSTRQRSVALAGRGRLVLPEGFREFLGVEPGGDVALIGAGVCVEIWQPQAWLQFAATQMPEFRQLFDRLTQ